MSETPKTPKDLLSELGGIFGSALKDTAPKDSLGALLNGVAGNLQTSGADVFNRIDEALTKAAKDETTDIPKAPKPTPKPSKPAPKVEKEAPKTESSDLFGNGLGLGDILAEVPDFFGSIVDDIGAVVGDLFGGRHAHSHDEGELYHVEFIELAPEPAVDIVERKDSIEYRIAVAGAGSEDLEVELDGDRLHVSVTTPKSADVNIGEEPLVTYAENGIWSGTWEETFYIPGTNIEGRNVEIDAEGVTANVKNGLATIVVPFKELVKATIKVS